MEIIYLLLPISLLLALLALVAYIWSVRNGQFDDLKTPAIRMLFEDEKNISQDSKMQEDEPSP